MKLRSVAMLAAIGALSSVANADANAYFEAYNHFRFDFGGDAASSMSASLVRGGPFEDFAATTTGDGYNFYRQTDCWYDGPDGMVKARGASNAVHAGTAHEFEGMNYFFDVTNNSTSASGSFTVSSRLTQYLNVWNGTATARGGIQEYLAPNNQRGSWTSTVIGYSTYSTAREGNFTLDVANSWPPDAFYVNGSLSDVLAPGQTVSIQVWASGETHATAPEPMTMGLGLGVLGLLARRRRKQS